MPHRLPEEIRKSLTALVDAVRDGVGLVRIGAGDDPPSAITSPYIYWLDDSEGNAGPAAFKADGVLDAAAAIYLHENGLPLRGEMIAEMARDCVFVLITCGASFRSWFQHMEQLGMLDKLYALSTDDPTRRLQ